mgnify:FL=1
MYLLLSMKNSISHSAIITIKPKLPYNRNGSLFKFKNCGFEHDADLNASRNIEILDKSEYFRLLSASQSLGFNENPLMDEV